MADEYIAFLQSLEDKISAFKAERDAILAEIGEYEKYESLLLENESSKGGEEFETLVDIGEGCYVQATTKRQNIPSAFIRLGLGIHVQFKSNQDLLEFIDRRKELLLRQTEWRYSKIAMMQADVDQMKQMLEQLHSIS